MIVDWNYFFMYVEVMEDIVKIGFWLIIYVFGVLLELFVYYYDYDIIGYCVVGGGYVLDGVNNWVVILVGDCLNILKGVLYVEGEVMGSMIYIVMVSEFVGLMIVFMLIDL